MTKAVLITGAARRLGAGMAEHLAGLGHHVAIHYHQSQTEAEALARKIGDAGGVCALLQGELACRDVQQNLVARASLALGRKLDILVNNASCFDFDRIDAGGYDSWDRNIKTNLEAPYFLTQSFAAQCQGEGQVINMIDQRVLRLTPNFGSYTLAKSALWTMTRTAAMALAPNIRVNAIGPGTTLQGAHQTDENFSHHRKISILERGADLGDILSALDYLLDAKNVTGQMIAVDGGQHLIWELPK